MIFDINRLHGERSGDSELSGSRAVLVVGAPRGGTAAIALALSRMGVPFGRKPVLATPHSFGSYSEDGRFARLHERAWRLMELPWHHVGPLADEWWGNWRIASVAAQVADGLVNEYRGFPVWGVEELGLSRLLPIWLAALDEIGVEPVFVIPIRSPYEVADSLARDELFSPTKGLLLWLYCMTDAEFWTRGRQRVFVEYDQALSDWRPTVDAVERAVGLAFPTQPADAASALDCLLGSTARPRREACREVAAHAVLGDALKTLEGYLRSLSCGGEEDPSFVNSLRNALAELPSVWAAGTQLAVRPGLSLTKGRTGVSARAPQGHSNEERGQPMPSWDLTESDAALLAERMVLRWRHNPSIHILVLASRGQEGLLIGTLESLNRQLYKGWGVSVIAQMPCPLEAGLEGGQIEWITLGADQDYGVVASNTIRETAADWVLLMDPGDRLAPHALVVLGNYANDRPLWKAIYTDDARIDDSGAHHAPRFKSDLNVELLRSMPYVGAACFLHRDALASIHELRSMPGAEVYDALLRIIERHGEDAIGHIPEILYYLHDQNEIYYQSDPVIQNGRRVVAEHLERLGIAAEVRAEALLPGSWMIEYRHTEQPLVSIIIRTRDQYDLISDCIRSLLAKTSYPNYEVLVIDDNSSDPKTLDFLESLHVAHEKARVLRYTDQSCLAAICNLAVHEARGDYILLLSNDTQIVQERWLERMMSHAQRREVGAVGPRLVFPDQRIQHAGVVLGLQGIAGHPYAGLRMDEPGYLGRAQLAQNYSAVTGACLLTRRSVFEEAGGLDEKRFGAQYWDVDFCLKIRERGYSVVWTPYATLVRQAAPSSQRDEPGRDSDGDPLEASAMLDRWLPQLARDPAYNRNLALRYSDGRVETEIIAGWNPDYYDRPRLLTLTCCKGGSREYRVLGPGRAMRGAEKIQLGAVSETSGGRPPEIVELARIAPDVLLIKACFSDRHLQALEAYRQFLPGLRCVIDLDDLHTEVPASSPKRHLVTHDREDRLRRALGSCERAIVSTPPLKEAFGGMVDDIVVVPNRLERWRWADLSSARRAGRKPRVGWAGAQQHHGDLALLRDVLEATANEVEWVFFGMCPQDLRPYVTEFRAGVSFDAYPRELASLNLDVAVAPLEVHRFNEAKTNLRLLEYGVFGWPVVCTDIEPYRAYDAPVTRVPNRPEAWIEAIRAHVYDLDASEQAGDRLRDWVLKHWILEDYLDDWFDALFGDALTDDKLDRQVARLCSPGLVAAY